MKTKHKWINTELLKTENVFENLFSRPEEMVDKILKHMKVHKFDDSQPINVWHRKEEESRDDFVVIDGHTRFLAAKKAELPQVYITLMDFPDEDTALKYAIHNQRDRRNITDAEIMRCIEIVDKRKKRGGDRRSESAKSKGSTEPIDTKTSAQETAKYIGTSETKVKKARIIESHADEQTKQEVRDGKKSINQGYKETQAKRKKSGLKNGNPTSVDSVIETITKQIDKIAHKISEQIEAGNNIKPEVYRALVRSYEDLQDEMVRLERAVGVESKRETARVLEYNI